LSRVQKFISVQSWLRASVTKAIAVEDRMCLGMQDFDFAQTQQLLPNAVLHLTALTTRNETKLL